MQRGAGGQAGGTTMGHVHGGGRGGLVVSQSGLLNSMLCSVFSHPSEQNSRNGQADLQDMSQQN